MLCQFNNDTGFPTLHLSLSAGGQRRPDLASFPLSSPPLNPWAEFLNHTVLANECKPQGHPCHPSMSFPNYSPGVVSEMQTAPDPCQDKSLPSMACPLPSTKENKSRLWKLDIATCLNGYVIPGCGKEGCGLNCTGRDTYRWLVLL